MILHQPWEQESSELALVRDWFYPLHVKRDPYETSHFTDMRRQAVRTVSVWTFKSHKVPHAIVATADLIDSMLHYDMMNNDESIISYRAVQFMFAFAFMRFVNGFVDRDIARAAAATMATEDEDGEGERPPKAAGESSMFAHAAAIGMPSRFVDLRHQVAHGDVPDLNILKTSAESALDWLWERWWKMNATGEPGKALRAFEERQLQKQRLLERVALQQQQQQQHDDDNDQLGE